MKKVFLILLNYLNYDETIKCTLNLLSQKKIDLKIVIVDNCSPNDSFKIIKEKFIKNDQVFVINSERNGGYSYGNNFGINFIKNHSFDFILISNSDIEITDDKLIYKMAQRYYQINNCALVAPVALENGKISNYFAWKLPTLFDDLMGSLTLTDTMYRKNRIYKLEKKSEKMLVDCVPGSFFMVSKEIFFKLNLFDENIFLYNEESILAFKVKQMGLNSYIFTDLFYEHNKSKIISSVFSPYKMRKLLIDSRLYFHEHYLKSNPIGVLFLRLLLYLWYIEYFIKSLIKSKY